MTGYRHKVYRLEERAMFVDTGVNLSPYTAGFVVGVSDSTPTTVAQNTDVTASDPRGVGYNTAVSWTFTDKQMNLDAGKYSLSIAGDTGSGLTTVFESTLIVDELPPYWTDWAVPAASMKIPAASAPTEVTWYTDLKKLSFAAGEFVYIEGVQLPHGYVPNTNIMPHVHFAPDSTMSDGDTVTFDFTYTLAPVWGLFPSTTTVSTTFTNNSATRAEIALVDSSSLSGTSIVAGAHLVTTSATISGTDMTLSGMIEGKLARGSSDTFGGEAIMLSADMHIQLCRFGSVSEFTG